MFRWSTAQPIPDRLLKHLKKAGGFYRPWLQRGPDVVLVYLAPHQLLSQGRLPLEAIRISYELTLTASLGSQALAIHGERLLQCNQQVLAQWAPGQPLPCHLDLEAVTPLDAVVTAVMLSSVPEIATAYQQLERLSERGTSPADLDYPSRLRIHQAETLIKAWNWQQTLLAAGKRQAYREFLLEPRTEEDEITARQVHSQALDLLQRNLKLFSRLLIGQVSGKVGCLSQLRDHT